MAQFIAMAPKIEVNGQTVLAIVEGMTVSKKKGFAILEKHGIVNPAPAG